MKMLKLKPRKPKKLMPAGERQKRAIQNRKNRAKTKLKNKQYRAKNRAQLRLRRKQAALRKKRGDHRVTRQMRKKK